MSKARHNLKDGGKPMINEGRESEEEEKMEEGHKKGGRAHRKHGGKAEMRGEGHKPKNHRLDRPGRKKGGSVGADQHPLSSAANTKDAEAHSTGESGKARQNPSDG